MIEMIWSDVAIDYSVGIDIYDPIEDKIYTQQEAEKLPQKIKSRLVNKGRVIGCWVKELKELNMEIL